MFSRANSDKSELKNPKPFCIVLNVRYEQKREALLISSITVVKSVQVSCPWDFCQADKQGGSQVTPNK